MKLNENRLHMDFVGAREQKVGFVLSLYGKVQHTFAGLKAVPHHLSLNGLLTCKNNIHDGTFLLYLLLLSLQLSEEAS